MNFTRLFSNYILDYFFDNSPDVFNTPDGLDEKIFISYNNINNKRKGIFL